MEILVVHNILEESELLGQENREIFDRENVFVLNLMSSPGSGKTSLLLKIIPILQKLGISCAVIEGDVTSSIDSMRLQELNIPIVQANTEPFGGACHIGPHLIKAALEFLDLSSIQILFIENIGNLVCPAEFYLGENCKIVVLSVTEGEDKPLKYPLMFRECDICIINKMDLLPYIDFDMNALLGNIRIINNHLGILFSSARTSEGIAAWIDWIINQKNACFKKEIQITEI